MSEDMNNEGRQPVRLNRKMRLWNKYRNYIIGAAAVIVVIIIFAVILKSCGSKKNNSKNDNNTTQNVSMESTEQLYKIKKIRPPHRYIITYTGIWGNCSGEMKG